MKRLLCLATALLVAGPASAQLPVVPGAPTGYGMDTRAAYACGSDPTVIKVTSLSNSGAGTFREAVEASGPRVVVFERSGYITLTADLNVTNPCLTVAGQTAPSPGITIKIAAGAPPAEAAIWVKTHDVLFQHFAIRPGSEPSCNSGVQVYGGLQYNVVFANMSFSWAQDENLGFSWTNGQDTDATVYRSISAESLHDASGTSGCTGGGTSHGHGLLVAAEAGNVAVVQSVLASNWERNPYMQGNTTVALVNNLIYQWHGPWGFFFNNANVSSSGATGPWYANVAGNRFVKGPQSTDGGDPSAYMFVYSTNTFGNVLGNKIYRSDNTIANQDGTVVTTPSNQYSYDPDQVSAFAEAPLPTGLSVLASTDVEAFVTAHSGARPADRDAVDTRILAYIGLRTGAFVSETADVGGYPSLATNTSTFTTVASPHVDSGNGYTNLEIQLHAFSALVEGEEPTGPDDVAPAAGAVIVSAAFTGTAGVNLSTITNAIGGGWAAQTGATGLLKIDNANRVLYASTSLAALTLATGTPLSAEYDIDVDLPVITQTSVSYSVWGRTSVDGGGLVTGYFMGVSPTNAMATLYQVVSDTYTILGSCSHTFSTGTTPHVTLRMRDASKHAVIDGTQCTSSATNVVTATGKAGLSALGSAPDTNTTGARFDTFLVTDVQGAAMISRLRFVR